MTFCSHKLLEGAGRALRCLSLALIPALTTEAGPANMAARSATNRAQDKNTEAKPSFSESAPYLAVIAPPALRFREAPAPISFELEPVPMGTAAIDDPSLPPVTPYQAPAAPEAEAVKIKAKVVTEEAKIPTKEVPTILPDDLRREVRPEDVLPFFQFPRGRATIGVSVPVPPQVPAPTQVPSSATYRQQ